MTTVDTGLTELRNVARALRGRIETLDPSSLAWALLWQADELHPWTEQAQACWERLPQPQSGHRDGPTTAEDCWRLHHLAVLHHARAYDAENATPRRQAEALRHWEKALEYWARLHRCPTFWDALRQHLDDATGKQVPPEVVDAVRERLPDDLLAVHTALAAEYRSDDPPAAAAHMRLVTQSDFPADSIAAARRGLVADLDNTTAQEIQRVRFGTAFDYVVEWLTIDPANPWLLRNLLYVTDSWARFIFRQPGWFSPMDSLLDRTEQILKTARAKLGGLPAILAGELARYEFWRGFRIWWELPDDFTASPPDKLQSQLRSAEVAVSHLRKAIDLDPSVRLEYYYEGELKLAKVLTSRAELKLLLGWDPREVNQDLAEARQYRPDLPEALKLLARLRSIRPDLGLEEELSKPNAPRKSELEGDSVEGDGADPNQMIDEQRDDGLSASELVDRGKAYLRGKRLDEALNHFNRAIELKPDYAAAIAGRGETYQDMNRLDESLADLNRAVDLRPDNTTFISHRAGTYRRMKRYDLALADCNRAVNLEPDTAWIIAARGQIYRIRDRFDEALADLNRAIELRPSYAWAIGQRGATYQDLNRFDEALADLTRSIDLDPNDAWHFLRRGEALLTLECFDEALIDLDHVMDIYSRETYPNPNLAYTLARRGETCRMLNRYDDALADLTRAIELVPDYLWALASRGEAYRAQGSYQEALGDLTRAIDGDPNYRWAIARRGQTYRDMNLPEQAQADLDRVADLERS
ncbi:MAG: tetratricopeptide repeat protein [Pseudonocardiaceae bacterium]